VEGTHLITAARTSTKCCLKESVAGNAVRTQWSHSTANSSVNLLFYCPQYELHPTEDEACFEIPSRDNVLSPKQQLL
jgi:hypothetical protein